MQPSSSHELTLRIPLGRLVSACDAAPGIYHVQDPSTGALVPVVLARRRPWTEYLRSWRGTLAGVAAGFAVLTVAGVWQYADMHAKAQAASAAAAPMSALPIAQPALADAQQPVKVVDEPYPAPVQEAAAAQQPLPLQPSAAQAFPVASVQVAVAAPQQARAPAAEPPKPAERARPSAPVPAAPPKAAAAALVRPPLPVAPPPAAATSTAPPASAKDDSPVVFNDLPPRPSAPARAAPAQSASATAAAAATAKPAEFKVRLVAIKDAQTALLHLPGSLLPVAVKVGGKLPNGARLIKADPSTGTVAFDNGSTLALE